MNLLQWRCRIQFVLAIAEDRLIGRAVVNAMPVPIDHGDHVCSVFTDKLKEAIPLSQLPTDTLQLKVLIDRVNIEQED